MFDKSVRRPPEGSVASSGSRPGPDDERIALRCSRRELQLLDSFVASGEFRSRSELMRKALRRISADVVTRRESSAAAQLTGL